MIFLRLKYSEKNRIPIERIYNSIPPKGSRVITAEIPIIEANESPHEAQPAATNERIPVPVSIRILPRFFSMENLFKIRVRFIPNKIPIIDTIIKSIMLIACNEPKKINAMIFSFAKIGYELNIKVRNDRKLITIMVNEIKEIEKKKINKRDFLCSNSLDKTRKKSLRFMMLL